MRRLAELGGKSKAAEPVEPAKEAQRKTAAEYRQRLISVMSMMLGVVTSVMIASITLFDSVRSKRLETALIGGEGKHLDLLMPFLAATMTMSVSLLAMMVYPDVVRRKREVEDEKRTIIHFETRPRTVKRPMPPDTKA